MRDGGICGICGYPGATSADHIVALADGGSHDPSNLRAALSYCNLRLAAQRTNQLRRQRRRYGRIPRIY